MQRGINRLGTKDRVVMTCIHVQVVIVLIDVHRAAHLGIVIAAETRGLDRRRLVLRMLLMMVLLHSLIIGGRSYDLLLLQL